MSMWWSGCTLSVGKILYPSFFRKHFQMFNLSIFVSRYHHNTLHSIVVHTCEISQLTSILYIWVSQQELQTSKANNSSTDNLDFARLASNFELILQFNSNLSATISATINQRLLYTSLQNHRIAQPFCNLHFLRIWIQWIFTVVLTLEIH